MDTRRPKSFNPSNDFSKAIESLKNSAVDVTNFKINKDAYRAYSSQIKETENLTGLSSLLKQMLAAKLYPDEVIINQLIKKLSLFKRIDYAIAVYKDACKKGVSDAVTHNSMIDAAGKYRRIDLANEAYANAMNAGIADVITHTSMIEATGKNGQIELAEKAYDNAKDVANVYTHNSMIIMVGRNGRMDLVEKAYVNALTAKVVNVVTYNSVIEAAGNNCKIDLVEKAYANALKEKLADVVTHTCMIDAAGKNRRMDLAEKAYANAMDADVANAVIHSCMINAAGKNGRIDLAEKVYANAIARGVVNVPVYNSMIDALILNNNFKEAEQVYKKSGIKLLPTKNVNNVYEIDLHQLSYGSAYFALKELIENSKKPFRISIIYGKGSHSKNATDEHPTKKAVKQLMKDIKEEYAVDLKEDEENIGKAVCRVQTKLKPEVKKDSIKAKATIFNQPTGLNPHAAEFKPKKTQVPSTSQMSINNTEFKP